MCRTARSRAVPFLLKDLGALDAGVPHTGGSRLYADTIAPIDNTLTRRYRAAGLVILGRTNTPEMGLNITTEPVLHGPTRNPYDLSRTAGGSSGGSAAAVAARMVPAAHGNDGGGSIRIPASHCGLFGLKPSRARTPKGPLLGEAWSGLGIDHVLSRSVRDSAALLDATHGPEPGDPYAAPPPARPFAEELAIDPGHLRIGFTTASWRETAVDPACSAAVAATAETCRELGHQLEEAGPELDYGAILRAVHTIVACSLRAALDVAATERGRPVREDEVERITWLFAREGDGYAGADYAAAVDVLHATGRRLAAFFERYDLFLGPTLAAPPWPLGRLDMMGEDLDAFIAELLAYCPFTQIFNVAGCPAASLPRAWTDDGLPVGVQLGARLGDEATILRLAAQLERVDRGWTHRPPL